MSNVAYISFVFAKQLFGSKITFIHFSVGTNRSFPYYYLPNMFNSYFLFEKISTTVDNSLGYTAVCVTDAQPNEWSEIQDLSNFENNCLWNNHPSYKSSTTTTAKTATSTTATTTTTATSTTTTAKTTTTVEFFRWGAAIRVQSSFHEPPVCSKWGSASQFDPWRWRVGGGRDGKDNWSVSNSF